MGGLPSWKIPRGHFNELLAPCKGIPDSLGFRIPGNRFWILCQWNLHIDFKHWWGSRFLEVYFGLQGPKSKFHQQNIPGLRIPQATFSLIPDSLTRTKSLGGGGKGTLGFSGWGCAAANLEPLTYTRASSTEFCYPILEYTPQIPPILE